MGWMRFLMLPWMFLAAFSPIWSQDDYAYMRQQEDADLAARLDFKQWQKNRLIKDQNPGWKMRIRDGSLKEAMGRVIHCVGECRLYRGLQFVKGQTRSLIKEGDDLETTSNSYGWVFLFDGSLLRISPESSVSFREFNVTKESFFLFLRLNKGHIFWANRTPSNAVKTSKLAETDVLFLPLPLRGFKQKSTPSLFKQLNQERKKNTRQLQFRPTWNLLTMTNGSLYGKTLAMEVFHQMGGTSFFKQKARSENRPTNSSIEFWYQKYNHRKTAKLSEGEVYQVGPLGQDLSSGPISFFSLSELLVKRIPSILIVREKWLRQYAGHLHGQQLSANDLASKSAHRLWEGEEMHQRIQFLQTYTRQIEVVYGYAVRNYQKQYGQKILTPKRLPAKYVEHALKRYARNLDRQ